jgi:hypothetical protein
MLNLKIKISFYQKKFPKKLISRHNMQPNNTLTKRGYNGTVAGTAPQVRWVHRLTTLVYSCRLDDLWPAGPTPPPPRTRGVFV